MRGAGGTHPGRCKGNGCAPPGERAARGAEHSGWGTVMAALCLTVHCALHLRGRWPRLSRGGQAEPPGSTARSAHLHPGRTSARAYRLAGEQGRRSRRPHQAVTHSSPLTQRDLPPPPPSDRPAGRSERGQPGRPSRWSPAPACRSGPQHCRYLRGGGSAQGRRPAAAAAACTMRTARCGPAVQVRAARGATPHNPGGKAANSDASSMSMQPTVVDGRHVAARAPGVGGGIEQLGAPQAVVVLVIPARHKHLQDGPRMRRLGLGILARARIGAQARPQPPAGELQPALAGGCAAAQPRCMVPWWRCWPSGGCLASHEPLAG